MSDGSGYLEEFLIPMGITQYRLAKALAKIKPWGAKAQAGSAAWQVDAKRSHMSLRGAAGDDSMIVLRAMVIVLGTFVTLTAFAQTKLSAFVEANGCKLLAAEAAVKRMKEIASQGSVTWDGNCKSGLIDGRGVLRQEGTVIIGGKTKKYAYFLSGIAKNGIRSGSWRRETFDRFVDSPRFYTS